MYNVYIIYGMYKYNNSLIKRKYEAELDGHKFKINDLQQTLNAVTKYER